MNRFAIFASLLAVVAVAASAACRSATDMILEYKDVQFFKLEQVSAKPMQLKISGLAFHSSMAVDNKEVRLDGKAMTILVHLVPTRPGKSGSFEYVFNVPDAVETVDFGLENHLIWNRSP